MASGLNTYSQVSSIAQAMQEDATLIARTTPLMTQLVQVFSDMGGGNERKNYEYSDNTAQSIGESDDLTSTVFEPSLLTTLTPGEIGLQYFVTDKRAASELPENIVRDGAADLGAAAADKIESDLLSDMQSFTGGTIGASGTTLTWGHCLAAIARARKALKNQTIPLVMVLHEYQWFDVAKAASIAADTSMAQAPQFSNDITLNYYRGRVANTAIFVTANSGMESGTDAYGGVFPRSALAFDVRRDIRIEPERDASRRGTEYNMSALYAHGVWYAKYGVQIISDITAPSS
jgi:hypothetical protein